VIALFKQLWVEFRKELKKIPLFVENNQSQLPPELQLRPVFAD